MPQYEISVPGKGTFRVESPTELTDAQAYAAIEAQLNTPDTAKSGFTAALKSGTSKLSQDMYTLAAKLGVMSPEDAQRKREEEDAYQKRTFKETETWGEAPFTKFSELLGGSLPYMAAPVVAGGAAAVLGAPGAIAAGAAGLASAAQFTGSNLSDQIKSGDNTIDSTNLGHAFAASVPQAALDVVGFKAIPLIRQLFRSIGKDVAENEAKEIAKKGFSNVAKDYVGATGKAMGVEGFTESAQEFFQRLQTVASSDSLQAKTGVAEYLLGDEAKKDYWDQFVGGAVLGGALAPAGRYVERRSELRKQEAEQRDAAAKAKKAELEAQQQAGAAAAAEQAQQRKDPAYVAKVIQDFEEANAKYKELTTAKNAAAKGDMADKLRLPELEAQLKQFRNDVLIPAAKEYNAVGGKTGAAKIAEDARIAALSPEEYALENTPNAPEPTTPTKKEQKRVAASQASFDEESDLGPLVGKPFPAGPTQAAQYAAQSAEEVKKYSPINEATVQDLVPQLMKNPQLAQQVVAERVQIPGLSRSDNEAVLGALKLQLEAQKKADAKRIAEAQQNVPANVAEGEEADVSALLSHEENQREVALDQERLAKKDDSQIVDEFVRKSLLRESNAPPPAPNQTHVPSKVVSGLSLDLDAYKAQQRTEDNIKAQIAYAQATNNAPLVASLKARLEKVSTRENRGGKPVAGVTLPAGVKEANAPTRIAAQQLKLFDTLGQFLMNIRRSRNPELWSKREGLVSSINSRVDNLRNGIIGHTLNEIEARRRLLGMQPLTTDEKTQIVGSLNSSINDLVSRSSNFFNLIEKTLPGQMRSGKVIRDAKTITVRNAETVNRLETPLEETRKKLRSVVEQYAPGSQPASVPEFKATRTVQRVVTPEAKKPLFLTKSPTETAAPYYEDVIKDALTSKTATTEEKALLSKIDAVYSSLSPENQTLVYEQAQRVASGQHLDERSKLVDALRAGEQARGAISEEDKAAVGQKELFSTEASNDRIDSIKKEISEVEAALVKEKSAPKEKNLKGIASLVGKPQRIAELNKRLASLKEQLKEAEKNARALGVEQRRLSEKEGLIRSSPEAFNRVAETQRNAPKPKVKTEAAFTQTSARTKQIAQLTKLLDKMRAKGASIKQQVEIENQIKALQAEPNKPVLPAKAVTSEPKAPLTDLGGTRVSRPLDYLEKQKELNTTLASLKAKLLKAKEKGKAPAIAKLEERIDALEQELKTLTENTTEKILPAEERVAARRAQEDAREVTDSEGVKAPVRTSGTVVKSALPTPRSLRTGSEESRAGITVTNVKNPPYVKVEKRAIERKHEGIDRALDKRLASLRSRMLLLKQRLASGTRKDGAPFTAADRKRYSTLLAKAEIEFDKKVPPRAFELYTKNQAELNSVNEQLAQLKPLVKKSVNAEQQAKRAARVDELTTLRNILSEESKSLKKVANDYAKKFGENKKAFIELGEDIEYSKGEAHTPSTTAQVKNELGQHFADTSKIRVFDTVEALVAEHPEYEGKIDDNAKGFVDPNTQQAFLIAENINQGGALAVALHEVGSHLGLERMLGKGGFMHHLSAVERWLEKSNGSLEYRIARAAEARVDKAKTSEAQRDSELLAYTIEEAVKAGVTPTATKSPIGRWLASLQALVRKALATFGLAPKGMTLQQLVDAAHGAAKLHLEDNMPSPTGPKGGGTEPLQFSKNMQRAGETAAKLVSQKPSVLEKLRKSTLGLGGRVHYVDALAASPEALKRGGADEARAEQANYWLRMHGYKNHFVGQAATKGVPKLKETSDSRSDGGREWIYESEDGANLKKVVDTLSTKEVIKAAGGADEANKLFTLYKAAKRGDRVGYEKLTFGKAAAKAEIEQIKVELQSKSTPEEDIPRLEKRKEYLMERVDALPDEAEIKAAVKDIEADPVLSKAFEAASKEYDAYNRDLIRFLVDTGAMSEKKAKELLAASDFIPYYRVRGGAAEMIIGGEAPIRIGNIKDAPYLQELIGGEEPIFNFLDSSMQNTSMIMDMGLRNMATKNLMNEFKTLGLATIGKAKKNGSNIPHDAVTFKVHGEDYFAVVHTEHIGIEPDLITKGLAGIPTMLPGWVKMMSIPSQFLRKMIVASPIYAGRALTRDSFHAAIASGADMWPVISAAKHLFKKPTLESRGITGGQVFTGLPDDMARMLKNLQAGKGSVATFFAKLEAMSMRADAATREAQYESYRKQGASVMQATLQAAESMNFSRRGLSPSVYWANQLIPFFNAQIQSLDVLYRSFKGEMPLQQKLDIRRKLFERGAIVAGLSMWYALQMQDDEAYKNATPQAKYSNWFVRIPGVAEPFKIPIPFEIGYLFKALPEAVVNMTLNDSGARDAAKTLGLIAQQIVPGGSSLMVPAAVKPLAEMFFNKSFSSMGNIESQKETDDEAFMRYRDNTTDLAKQIGNIFNVSPLKIEHLVNGYTGSIGVALMGMASIATSAVKPIGPEGAERKLSQTPVIGTLFQANDASGIIDAAYELMKEVREANHTYKALIEKGRTDEAQAYVKEKAELIAYAQLEGQYAKQMGELTKAESAIKAYGGTPEEKRAALDDIKKVKIALATVVRDLANKNKRQ